MALLRFRKTPHEKRPDSTADCILSSMYSIAWSVEWPDLNPNCLLKSMLYLSIKLISRLYINLSSILLKIDKRDIGR